MSAVRRGSRPLQLWLAAWLMFALAAPAGATATRVSELTRHAGDIPRRIVGYGLVTGLDGTGDRSFGRASASSPSVRSVANLLRRFQIEVPAEQLRLRNVAAVVVTAELSPWLRAGGRFDVQVSALGDATSLHGGSLWITPLVADPGQPPIATAQGTIDVTLDEHGGRSAFARGNSGRVNEGGVLETEAAVPASLPRLLMREPDLLTARLVASAIDTAFGAGTATVQDAGAIDLKLPAGGSVALWLAAMDTVDVSAPEPARIVIDSRDGTVVAGGVLRVGSAVVSHGGVTLQIGGSAAPTRSTTGDARTAADANASSFVQVAADASVQDVAAGLHAAGARGPEIAAVFQALRAAGALRATVVVR